MQMFMNKQVSWILLNLAIITGLGNVKRQSIITWKIEGIRNRRNVFACLWLTTITTIVRSGHAIEGGMVVVEVRFRNNILGKSKSGFMCPAK